MILIMSKDVRCPAKSFPTFKLLVQLYKLYFYEIKCFKISFTYTQLPFWFTFDIAKNVSFNLFKLEYYNILLSFYKYIL